MGHMKKGSKAMKKAPFHHTMITHHHDGSHSVEHHPHPSASKSGAFMSAGPAKSYAAEDGHALMSKLHEHLGIEHGEPDGDEGEMEES